MPSPSDVSMQEVDDAFYKSYGEGSPKGLDARLVDPKTKGRRKLTLDTADAEFRECWMETRRLLREAKGYCPPKGTVIGAPVLACPSKSGSTDRPKYEPSLWNDGGAIQRSTNCYAYAMDSRVGHQPGAIPQPGQKSAISIFSPVGCPDVTNAVVHDGKPDKIIKASRCPFNEEEQKPPPNKAGYYLVALVVTSKPTGYDAKDGVWYENDYHWYRQDEDGSWSHKPGQDVVRNTDSNKSLIPNPETATRRTVYPQYPVYIPIIKKSVPTVIDYDIFCGYFHVKKGGVAVGR